jgi:hypothetical protein
VTEVGHFTPPEACSEEAVTQQGDCSGRMRLSKEEKPGRVGCSVQRVYAEQGWKEAHNNQIVLGKRGGTEAHTITNDPSRRVRNENTCDGTALE